MSAERVETPNRAAPCLVTSVAADALQEGLHTVSRHAVKSLRRAMESLEDAKDDSVHYVKHRPLRTVGIAAGVGLMAGLAAGWIAARAGMRSQPA